MGTVYGMTVQELYSAPELENDFLVFDGQQVHALPNGMPHLRARILQALGREETVLHLARIQEEEACTQHHFPVNALVRQDIQRQALSRCFVAYREAFDELDDLLKRLGDCLEVPHLSARARLQRVEGIQTQLRAQLDSVDARIYGGDSVDTTTHLDNTVSTAVRALVRAILEQEILQTTADPEVRRALTERRQEIAGQAAAVIAGVRPCPAPSIAAPQCADHGTHLYNFLNAYKDTEQWLRALRAAGHTVPELMRFNCREFDDALCFVQAAGAELTVASLNGMQFTELYPHEAELRQAVAVVQLGRTWSAKSGARYAIGSHLGIRSGVPDGVHTLAQLGTVGMNLFYSARLNRVEGKAADGQSLQAELSRTL